MSNIIRQAPLEARCVKCGETFTPADMDDLEHIVTSYQIVCGGAGIAQTDFGLLNRDEFRALVGAADDNELSAAHTATIQGIGYDVRVYVNLRARAAYALLSADAPRPVSHRSVVAYVSNVAGEAWRAAIVDTADMIANELIEETEARKGS